MQWEKRNKADKEVIASLQDGVATSVDMIFLTQVLQMNPDLVHPTCEGSADHHTRAPIETHPLKLCPALLPVTRHLAHSDLVAHHLHWLTTLRLASEIIFSQIIFT